MSNPNEKNIDIGGITLIAIEADKFAVPGRGAIKGRANAIRAAKNIINSNTALRVARNRAMRNG